MTKKHYFPGGNTSKGFVNYFDGIIAPWEENNRIYVLKGGPGVGKNTFMRTLAERAEQRGYDVCCFHCASDGDSLDAVRIPQLGVTMLDGTAPHVIDPVTPGAVDGILNLGVHLDETGLQAHREEIQSLQKRNSLGYHRTFAHLAAAGRLQENSDHLILTALDRDALRHAVYLLMESYRGKRPEHAYPARRLFASAITPKGLVQNIGTILGGEKVVCLSGPTAAAAELLRMVSELSKYQGYRREIFYSPLLPEQPEHLILPDLGLCLTTDCPAASEYGARDQIDLTKFCDDNILKRYQEDLSENQEETASLIAKAIRSLNGTKAIHDDMESIYKKYMDFSALDLFCGTFLDQLFGC